MTKYRVITKAVIFNGEDVLTLRRSPSAPRRPKQWDLPGGYADDGEDLFAACVREIREETGLRINKFELLLAHSQSRINESGGSDSLLIYIGKSNSREIKLSYEHSEYFWGTLDKAIEQETHPLHLKALNYIKDNKLTP